MQATTYPNQPICCRSGALATKYGLTRRKLRTSNEPYALSRLLRLVNKPQRNGITTSHNCEDSKCMVISD
jgi:hypothetical protein